VAQPESEATVVDGVTYVHARGPANNRPVLLFALQASKVIAAVARENRVAAIHAASNHTNALPALIAARKLGIPFHYEMRGLWELTRVSRMPEFEGSQAYLQGLELEGLVARNADRVFVISSQLGHYLTNTWGISTERMTLLPNCIDPEHFVPADPDEVEPNTIGYAGSLMPYEGLDTLISAIALLQERGMMVRVHIIGDGESKPHLEEQVQRLGLTDRIRFFGKVPPDSAREMLGRCALVCIPRKPFQVCEIVPPIKLVEALAMAKPVIVPDLPVFRDELGGAPVGWFFQSGDAIDLARVVENALNNQEERLTRGLRAREYAVTNRCWRHFVPKILSSQGVVV
jgi:glycosyltransferase involved in cell wall biosynthesis